MGRLVVESGGYAGIEVAQQALALATTVALLGWIAPGDFGRLTLALVIGQIGTTLATLGLEFTVLRQYLVWPEHRRAGAFSAALALALGWATLLAVVAWLVREWIDVDLRRPVLLAWFGGLVLGIRGLPLAISRVNGWLRRYAAVVVGGSIVQAAMQVTLVMSGRGIEGFVEGQLAGAAASTLLALSLSAPLFTRPQLEPGTLTYTAAILPSNLGGRMLQVSDRLVLSLFVPAETLGAYGLASRLALPVKMVGGIFRTALAPALSRAEHTGDLSSLFTQSMRLLLLATLALATGIALGSVLLYVSPWAATAPEVAGVLGLLLWAQVVATLQALGTLRIYYSARPAVAGLASGIGAAVLLLGLSTLAPRWGGTGAAVAELVAAAAATAAAVVYLRGGAERVQWGAALVLVGSFGLVAAACQWLAPMALVATATVVLAGYGVALATTWAKRPVRGEDVVAS